MAQPIVIDHYRAMVVMPGKSNRTEDVYVNNFVFRNHSGADPNGVADHIVSRITAFFNGLNAGSNVAAELEAAYIGNPFTVKVYDLGQPAPRLPMTRTFTASLPSVSTTPYPPEVALCLSYYAGRPLPRRRGRIFLGPMKPIGTVSGGKHMLPTAKADVFKGALEGLMSESPTADVRWAIMSHMNADAHRITGGWIDNAFDTQRRRGTTADLRTLWGAPPANV